MPSLNGGSETEATTLVTVMEPRAKRKTFPNVNTLAIFNFEYFFQLHFCFAHCPVENDEASRKIRQPNARGLSVSRTQTRVYAPAIRSSFPVSVRSGRTRRPRCQWTLANRRRRLRRRNRKRFNGAE